MRFKAFLAFVAFLAAFPALFCPSDLATAAAAFTFWAAYTGIASRFVKVIMLFLTQDTVQNSQVNAHQGESVSFVHSKLWHTNIIVA